MRIDAALQPNLRSETALNWLGPVMIERGDVPEEARRIRMMGCPDTRQFEVLELGTMLLLREVATIANPHPGDHVATLPLARLLNAMATDVLKANDAAEAATPGLTAMAAWSWSDVYPRHRVVTLVLPEDEAADFLDQAWLEARMIAPDVVLGMPSIAFGPEPSHDPVTVTITAEPDIAPETTASLLSLASAAAAQLKQVGTCIGRPDERNTPAPAIVPQTDHEIEKPARTNNDALRRPKAADAGEAARATHGAGGGNIVILPCVRREALPETPAAVARPAATPARPRLVEIGATGRDLVPARRRSVLDERPAAPEPVPPARMPRWNPATGKRIIPGTVTAADRQMVADAIAAGFPITKCPPRKHSVEIGQPDAGFAAFKPRSKTRRARLEERAGQ